MSSNSSSTSSLLLHQHIHYVKKNRIKSMLKSDGIIPPSPTNLQVDLVEPILFFRGTPEESVGCFLRGKLILNLNKPTKIRKIEMKFIGKMKTFWPEGKVYTGSGANRNDLCEECEIISHKWTFLISPNSSNLRLFTILRSGLPFQLLDAGTHIYDFELYLPGNLPESVDVGRGKISYKIIATAVRSGLQPNFNATRRVTMVRTPIDERNVEGIIFTNNWKNKLNYEINIAKKAYLLGEPIQVELKFTPRVQDIHVVGVHVKLNERSTYKANGQKFIESRFFNAYQTNNLEISESVDENGNIYYQKFITLQVPKCTGSFHHSCKSSGIIIAHKLNFIFSVITPVVGSSKSKKNKFDVDIPITLLSCICIDDLPTYDEGENLSTFACLQNRLSMDLPPSYEKSIYISNEDQGRRQTTSL